MENNHLNSPSHKRQGKDTEKVCAKKLFTALYKKPLSRRMAATEIGFTDQTYMVTQDIFGWIKQGKAQVIGAIRCSRSGRWVQKVTTNPEWFIEKSDNQLKMF